MQAPARSEPPRVIVIGIDGGTLDLAGPWADAGELPALSALMRGGASGALLSTQPPLTPVAWSSMLTGCAPARHGTFGFLRIPRDRYAPEFLCGGSLTLPTVFEMASDAGLRVGAINVPWTWPPRPVSGFWLSGLDAPAFGPEIAHPAGLFEELAARFDGYFDKLIPRRREGYALDGLETSIAKLGGMTRYLARTRPVELLAVVFTASDQVQHWFWHERSVIARDGRRVEDLLLHTWRVIDEQIGLIVEECAGPDTIILVISDHGAGPCEGGINLNRWLAEQGMLGFAGGGAGLRGLALRAGRMLPERLRERLRGRAVGRRRQMLSEVLARGIAWAETDAFCWSDYGALSLNLEGRFAAGRVPEGRREVILDELGEALLALRDPQTGERVMSAPLRGEDLYGAHPDAPDLLAVTRGYRREILSDFTTSGPLPGDLGRRVFGPSVRQATHRLEGMLCACGPGVRPGFVPAGARIEDIAPTVLHVLGEAVPEYMDGRALTELFARGSLAPPRREDHGPARAAAGDGYSAEERARVERDLGALGYL